MSGGPVQSLAEQAARPAGPSREKSISGEIVPICRATTHNRESPPPNQAQGKPSFFPTARPDGFLDAAAPRAAALDWPSCGRAGRLIQC